MTVFLGPVSSLRYWRSKDPYHGEQLIIERMQDGSPVEFAHTIKQLETIQFWGLRPEDGPLDIVVPDASLRTGTSKLSVTVLPSSIFPRAFCRAYKDVCVCSPELTFILMGAKCSFYPLLELGYELCGSYSIDDSNEGFFNHDPLTTAQDILEVLDGACRIRGSEPARKAVRHIVDNTRSPSESVLAMMLALPTKLRGFGLDGFTSNEAIPVSVRLRSQTSLPDITPDLYWRDHSLCVEYESTGFHGAASTSPDIGVRRRLNRMLLAKDSRKRRAYDALGITALTVTGEELADFEELTRIARVLSKHMGAHGLNLSPSVQLRRLELHDWLIRGKYTGHPAPSAGAFDRR